MPFPFRSGRPWLSVACIVVALVSSAGAASATKTFYVSASKGSDSNDGTAPTRAWQSLPFAVANVDAGSRSSLLLRTGDVFDLTAPLVLPGWGSGVADGSLPNALLSSYDDGQDPVTTPRPWIRRDTSADPAGPVLQCVNCSGLSVSGLEVSGGEQGLLFSFLAPADSWGGIAVQDCFLHDIRGTAGGGNPLGWGSAIGFNASARSDVVASNVSLVNNLFNASDVAWQNCITAQTHGGCVWPGGGAGGYVNMAGLLFASNLVNHVSFNAAFFAFTSSTRVAGNTFLNDAPSGLFPLGTTDIIVGSVGASVAFTNNEIANRGEFQGGPDGCGIDLEDSSEGVVLSDNYISRTWGAAFLLFAGTGDGSKNISLLRNVLLLDGCNQTAGDHGLVAFLHPGQTGVVDGNVLSACAGAAVFYGDTSGFTFANNTVVNASALPAALTATPTVVLADAPGGFVAVDAACSTPGAVLHYTLDGSRVTTAAPVWPKGGIQVRRAAAVLVKAFAPGRIESPVAGGVIGAPRP